MSGAPAAARERCGPFLVWGGLLLGISGPLALCAIAARYPDVPVVADAWSAERELLADARAAQRARAAGLELRVEAQPVRGGVRVLAVLGGASAGPLGTEQVLVRRTRPAQGGFDQEFELAASGREFGGEVPLPRPGRWLLRVRARSGAALLERELEWLSAP